MQFERLPRLFATLVSGLLADRFGRRQVVLFSLWLYIGGSILSAMAPNAIWMVLGRVLQAASSSVVLAVSRAIIHDIHGDGKSIETIVDEIIGYLP